MKYNYAYQTVVGTLWFHADENSLTGISFREHHVDGVERETDVIRNAFRQVDEYLRGKRREFDLPLNPAGTPFQLKVWEALRAIPYGETRTYKQVAETVGNPKGCRAVGMANNRNPLPIVIPCHRVVGTNGKLVGYAGGLGMKEQLLKIEHE